MRVPKDPDNFDPNKFPHFHVFCILQLGRRMIPGEHFDNAKVIASFSKDEIRKATLEDFLAKGLIWSSV